MATSFTGQLARAWADTTYADLPDAAVSASKRHILDTLAVAIAGIATDEARHAATAMLRLANGATGSSTLWGSAQRISAGQAALVNATATHARDFDDSHGVDHSGAVVIPAALAAAEAIGCDGKSLIVATNAGYDIGRRVLLAFGGYDLHNERGWHSTGTAGSFASAAAVATLLRLPSEQFTHALGIAGSFTGGVWAFISDRAMTKRLHPGKAAETGLEAAFLADAGYTGPGEIFEADWGGLFNTYNGGISDVDVALAGLGQDFLITQATIKPYACCRESHSAIDAILEVTRSQSLTAADFESIEIHASEIAINMVSVEPVIDTFSAQFSLPYAVAVAITAGAAGLGEFDPPRMDDPVVRRLLQSTSMRLDPQIPNGDGARLEISRTDGTHLTITAIRPELAKGAHINPLSDEEVRSKAQSLLEPRLGTAATKEVIATIENFEEIDDIGSLIALLCVPS